MEELINCTYKQWELWACHNPPVCANAYGFVSCGNWFEIILLSLITSLIIFLIIFIPPKEKQNKKMKKSFYMIEIESEDELEDVREERKLRE